MSNTRPTFNLVYEPWIRAQRLDGSLAELSILELFQQADQVRQLLGELPTQVFAINRLLLAIMYRSVEGVTQRAWEDLWTEQALPMEEIESYLSEWSHRFDLLHANEPFYQVADLHTTKNEFTELARLIGDAPVGHPFLTTRLKSGIESLSFAEAARWVVHCQAFDPSGIKSGAVGDPRVKGGKGYPIGMGAAGHLGGVLIEGQNQFQTLLLNLVPQTNDEARADMATWENSPVDGATPRHPKTEQQPEGLAELLTWQSRRIRLAFDDTAVSQVLICNGDRFSAVNLNNLEPMTAWRRSPTQEKKLGITEAYMPRAHAPDREFWRGLEALLARPALNSASLPPRNLTWISQLVDDDVLPQDFVPLARAIGAEYINQGSIIGEIIDDELAIPARLLQSEQPEIREHVLKAVEDTDQAVTAYARLRAELDKAAGGDGDSSVRDAGRAEAYSILDKPFRDWLVKLRHVSVTPSQATEAWAQKVRGLLLRLAEDAMRQAGSVAWVGRIDGNNRIDSGSAEKWFRVALFRAFPFSDDINDKESA